MINYAFIDIETTGLDETQQEIFELAIVNASCNPDNSDTIELIDLARLHLFFAPEDIENASEIALEISRFKERITPLNLNPGEIYDFITKEKISVKEALEKINNFLEKRHLVGANPAFDAKFIAAWLRKNNASANWHHRMIDIENLDMQQEGLFAPRGLQTIAKQWNIEDSEKAHTAMGDVETTITLFKLITDQKN
jgi:DNA polymerase III alpha subunit (gram-positive type)